MAVSPREHSPNTRKPSIYVDTDAVSLNDDALNSSGDENSSSVETAAGRRARQGSPPTQIPASKTKKLELEEEINLAHLQDLRSVFDQSDIDQGGTLDIDEFVHSFSILLGDKMTTDQLRTLFLKIDANANGWIDWDEFSTFLLLGSDTAIKMRDDGPAREFMPHPVMDRNLSANYHKDLASRLLYHPKSGRVLSASRDGTVKVWNDKTLMHEDTIVSSAKWINDMVYMQKTDRIAVCGMDRTISIYDCNKFDLLRKFKGKIQPSSALTNGCPHGTMPTDGVSFGTLPRNFSFQAMGSTTGTTGGGSASDCTTGKGEKPHSPTRASAAQMQTGSYSSNGLSLASLKTEFIAVEDLTVPMCMAYHAVDGGAEGDEEYLMIGVEEGCILMYLVSQGGVLINKPSVSRSFWVKPHKDWVTKIKLASELDAIISCSVDKTIKQTNLEKSKVLRSLDGHKKTVFSIDWSPYYKLIASCGQERDVMLWNPFINSPLATLSGHKASLVDVVFNDKDHQLISLSTDKVIKIWDVRNYRCLQTLSDKRGYTPEDRVNAIMFDPINDCLYSASNVITAWPMKRNTNNGNSNFRGHQDPVVDVLYNKRFNQVISADSNSVCVWDVEAGDLVFKFNVANKITSINLDDTERRLITGFDDGSVKVWNFINGQVLKECHQECDKEITSVAFIENEDQELKSLVGSGLGRKVALWDDNDVSKASEPARETQSAPSDILSMAYCAPSTLAIGTEDATIHLYNLGTGEIRSTFRVLGSKKLATRNPRFPASYTNEPPLETQARPSSVPSPRRLIKSIVPSPSHAAFANDKFSSRDSSPRLSSSFEASLLTSRISQGPLLPPISPDRETPPDLMATPPRSAESPVLDSHQSRTLVAHGRRAGKHSSPISLRRSVERSDSSLTFGRHSVSLVSMHAASTTSPEKRRAISPSKSILFSPSRSGGDHLPTDDSAPLLSASLPGPLLRPPPLSIVGESPSVCRSSSTMSGSMSVKFSSTRRSSSAQGSTRPTSGGGPPDSDPLQHVVSASHIVSEQPLHMPEDSHSLFSTTEKRLGYTNVEDLLFLQKKDHCVVSCGGDGCVRFWDLRDGRLLYCLRGIRRPGESLTCLSSDAENMYLAAGDSQGYVTIWYIANAASKWVDAIYDQDISLVRSFRAHEESMRGICFVERRECIVTGATDCNVKLYTLSGDLIGIFGQHERWSLRKVVTRKSLFSASFGRRNQKQGLQQPQQEVREAVFNLIRSKVLSETQLPLSARGGASSLASPTSQ